MAAVNDTCRDSDDIDTLTVMNDDVFMDASSSKDPRHVSQVQQASGRALTSRSTFGS